MIQGYYLKSMDPEPRQFRAGTLNADDKQTLPADFDRILVVYDDFGDVQRQQFLPW